jgi:hypothetical protein
MARKASDKIFVVVDEKQKALVMRVAKDCGLSVSAFLRQAAMEKALGTRVDKPTGELIAEIQEIKALVQERNKAGHEASQAVAAAATIEVAGIPEAEIKGKILQLLSSSPPLNIHGIAVATGYPEKIAFVVAAKLVDQGLLVLDERTFEYRPVK